MQDLQPPAAWQTLVEPRTGALSSPVSLFRHVTLAESVYPAIFSSQLQILSWTKAQPLLCLIRHFGKWRCEVGRALCHERAIAFHLSSGNLESQHVSPPKNGHQATSWQRLLTLVSSLPATFLLCTNHVKVIRCKERGDVATSVKAFAWEGERLEFWFCFKAAYVVLCYRSVSYFVIQAAFHPFWRWKLC